MQPGITIPQNATVDHHQPAGPGLGDAAGPRPRRRVLGQIELALFVNKAGLQAIGDNLFLETPASGTPQDGTPERRRLRRPAAGQSRTGQRRGGDRNLRPDRRAARLRDERQGHHRGRPDAAGDLQHDALRSDAMIRIAVIANRSSLLRRSAGRASPGREPPSPRAQGARSSCGEIVRIGDLVENAGARRRRRGVPRARSRPDRHACRRARVLEAVRPHEHRSASTPAGSPKSSVTRASRTITAQGDRGAHRRARSPASYGLGDVENLTVTFDRDVRALHVEPSATAELCARAHELRAAHAPLRRHVRAPRSAAARRLPLRYTGTVDRDRRGRGAAARRSRAARSSRRATSMIERRPKTEFAGEPRAGAERGRSAWPRAARCAPARRCAPPT